MIHLIKNIYNEKINNCDERIVYLPPNEIVHEEQSMLLCLLVDGRQLTLDEIDRILFYLRKNVKC